jgi:hypothetical protein
MHVKLYNEIKICHTVGTTRKYNSKFVEKGKIDTLNTQILTFLAWYMHFEKYGSLVIEI